MFTPAGVRRVQRIHRIQRYAREDCKGYVGYEMRWSRVLLGLAIAQIVLASIVIIASLFFLSPAIAPCLSSAVLALIGASLGVGAFTCCRSVQFCLGIFHFVLAILAIVDGIAAIVVVTMALPGFLMYGGYLIIIGIVLLIEIALVIICIISTCFTCNAWRRGSREPPTAAIIYTPESHGPEMVTVHVGPTAPKQQSVQIVRHF